MAFPVAAAIAGGTGLGSSIIAASATQKANHDARNFALMQGDIDYARGLEQFGLQNNRDDEVWNRQNQYNEKLWHMQNDYNSPEAQMQRYREAGLNPNLIYGQSNTGGSISSAPLDSGHFSSTGRPANWKPDVPNFDLQNGVMSYFSAMESQARTDNLKAQTGVAQQEALLKGIEGAKLSTEGARSKFELEQAQSLGQIYRDTAAQNLRRLQVESDMALSKNEREKAMNSMSIAEGYQRISNMRNQNVNTNLDSQLKKLDIDLRKMGIQPNDNMLFRILGRAMGNDSVDNLIKDYKTDDKKAEGIHNAWKFGPWIFGR